jgi:glycosyltransferase involved in cell wall biosynthesis
MTGIMAEGQTCMQNKPFVSIIMNCYDSATYLKEAIESVIQQTYDNWEIVFWDNQSTDASAEIARSFQDERIKIYFAEEHTGLGKARNLALHKCKGDYVTFLDCDDIWMPYKLERQVQLFETRPHVDFIHGNYYLLDEEKKSTDLIFKIEQPEGDIFGHLLHDYRIGILTVMIRKSVLNNMETLFDLNLILTEDYELFMRILYSSKAAYIHDPLAYYRVHSDMSSYVYRNKWVEEYRYVNKRFKTLDKENRYSKEIFLKEKQITVAEAAINMAEGRLRKARSVLSPFKFENMKYFVIYLATFLPVSVWLFLRPIWRRGVLIR